MIFCKNCKTKESKKWIGVKNNNTLCIKCYRKKWYIENKKTHNERNKEWRCKNKEYNKKRNKKWALKNKEKTLEYAKKWYIENKEKKKERNKLNYLKNKEIVKERTRINKRKYRKNNINFKVSDNLRKRLRSALKNNSKKSKTLDYLGCSIEYLKKYLEDRFQEGMSWDNYGDWHIDHVKPLSSFDLSVENNIYEACNYKNLQPLWAKDNLSKSNKV